jgi:two-component system phosphate regulon response regulator PhoB
MLHTILIVDDEPDILNLLRLSLEMAGYRTCVALNADQALASLDKEPPDLVLCDIVMPGRDGYAVLAAIRNNPATRRLPVLIISARGRPQDIEQALKAGANGYIVKPFSRRQLLSEIRRCLEPASNLVVPEGILA